MLYAMADDSARHALPPARKNWQAYAYITAWSLVSGTGRLPKSWTIVGLKTATYE